MRRRHDRPTTLFNVDPPYCGSEGDYGKELFGREDFEALSARLKALRGTFMMSINDVPEIRDLFSWATIEPVETSYMWFAHTSCDDAHQIGTPAVRAGHRVLSNRHECGTPILETGGDSVC